MNSSRTLTGAWIETLYLVVNCSNNTVAPSRVRGLKLDLCPFGTTVTSRTLTGAWIETLCAHYNGGEDPVAPSRVRGLKLFSVDAISSIITSHPHGCVD